MKGLAFKPGKLSKIFSPARRISLIFMAFFLLASFNASAQQKEVAKSTNGWFMLMNQVKINNSWYFSNELHIRRADVYQNWQQFLVRPAINYSLNPNVELAVGYSYIKNYPYGDQPVKIRLAENNIWQQLLLKQNLGKVGISHRYRLEERFIDHIQQDPEGVHEIKGTNYAQRFRYRLTVQVPLVKINEQREFFAAAFDELWVNLENNLMVNSFNQNWFYVGLGYQFSAKGNIQAGYLNQVIRKGDGIHYEINPTASISLIYNFDLSK